VKETQKGNTRPFVKGIHYSSLLHKRKEIEIEKGVGPKISQGKSNKIEGTLKKGSAAEDSKKKDRKKNAMKPIFVNAILVRTTDPRKSERGGTKSHQIKIFKKKRGPLNKMGSSKNPAELRANQREREKPSGGGTGKPLHLFWVVKPSCVKKEGGNARGEREIRRVGKCRIPPVRESPEEIRPKGSSEA